MKWLKIYFYLFVISTLISQSLMDFFSVLFCGQWAWIVWQSKKTAQPQKLLESMGLELIFLVWWIVCAIGFALNPIEPLYAASRLIEFKWIFIFYVMIQILRQLKPNPSNWKFLFGLLGVIGFATCLIYFLDIPLFAELRYGSGAFLRAGGLFADPMTYAHSFALLLTFLLGIALVNFKQFSINQKIAVALALFFGLLSLYLSFTRGVWIGFTIGVFSVWMIWRPRWACIALLAGALTAVTLFQYSGDFRWRLTSTWQEATGASERKLLWKAHFLEFQEHPIFGVGYGQNTKMLPEAYKRLGIPENTLVSHAHNQYLHLAAGTGILGLLCYLIIWFFFLNLLWRLYLQRALSSWDRGAVLGLFMGQISFLVGGFTEANFEHSKVRFLLMLAWAYIIFLSGKYNVKVLSLGRKE